VRIAQMSDIHVGAGFHPELLEAAIEKTNAFASDLVAIPGDLTMEGHREEFEEAKSYLDRLECPSLIGCSRGGDSTSMSVNNKLPIGRAMSAAGGVYRSIGLGNA
jgi:3',5'-cyclic AMP phosphodiesterase CpdA